MRIHDTFTRSYQELPPPPGPIRMYFCGPTVYQRIHIGNARPFVLSMWLKRWLERTGYEVTLVENITDINDKIYAAAPGAAPSSPRTRATGTSRTRACSGSAAPTTSPRRPRPIPQIVSLIEELVASGHAYPAGGDVYFRVSSFSDYGRLSGRHEDEDAVRNPSEEAETEELKEDPRDFALWKAHKEGEDTWWDSPWGRGRPGWHIECSAMAEALSRARVRDPRRRARPDLPAPRERGRAVALGRPRVRADLDAQRDAAAGRREDVEVAREHRLATGRARTAGAARPCSSTSSAATSASRSTTRTTRWSRRRRRRRASATSSARGQTRSDPGGGWERFAAALDDDFNTPEALAVMHGVARPRAPATRARGLRAGVARRERGAPAELEELARLRAEARERKDFAEGDRLRDEIEAAGWQVRDVDAEPGFQLVPKR